MDHDEVREQLELAAVEPGGIDRLMAGDTPLAAAVAGHLAGCPSCTDELMRLRRSAFVIAEAVRSAAPPELRERTLAHVAAYGRVLPAAASAASAGNDAAPAPAAVPVAGDREGPAVQPGRRIRRLGWVAGMAAALVIAVLGTTVILDARYGQRLADQEAGAAGLSRVTTAALALASEPDVTRVALGPGAGAGGADLDGTLAYSPASADLVVIASGLTEPAADREYRCWVEVDGARRPVGRMFFGGELAFWAGRAETVADLPSGSTFGVSLVDADGESLEGPAVLSGTVGG
jgi:hypothetical protein